MIKILDMFFDCKHDRWLQTIYYYFTRFASKNFRAALDDGLKIEQYSSAASARKEKIVDFFVCLHGAGPICK